MGQNNVKKARTSVSAEVYGRFNTKNLFVPVVVNKSEAVKTKYVFFSLTIF